MMKLKAIMVQIRLASPCKARCMCILMLPFEGKCQKVIQIYSIAARVLSTVCHHDLGAFKPLVKNVLHRKSYIC
jgi:hypothetical protein